MKTASKVARRNIILTRNLCCYIVLRAKDYVETRSRRYHLSSYFPRIYREKRSSYRVSRYETTSVLIYAGEFRATRHRRLRVISLREGVSCTCRGGNVSTSPEIRCGRNGRPSPRRRRVASHRISPDFTSTRYTTLDRRAKYMDGEIKVDCHGGAELRRGRFYVSRTSARDFASRDVSIPPNLARYNDAN